MKKEIISIVILGGLILLSSCNDHGLPSPTGVKDGQFSNFEPVKNKSGTIIINEQTGKPYNQVNVDVLIDGEVVTQSWFAENIVGHKEVGKLIDLSSREKEAATLGFYSFKISQKVCPEGWRVPGDKDWRALIIKAAQKNNKNCLAERDPVFMNSLHVKRFPEDANTGVCMAEAGVALKADSTWGGYEGKDVVHFGGEPEGYIDIGGAHLQLGEYAYFWSNDTITNPTFGNGESAASSWYLTKSAEVVHEENFKELYLSVRCIKGGE